MSKLERTQRRTLRQLVIESLRVQAKLIDMAIAEEEKLMEEDSEEEAGDMISATAQIENIKQLH